MVWQPPKDKPVYNLNVAYSIAREKLAQADVQKQCERSGAELQLDGTLTLCYLNQTYCLDIDKATISLVDNAQEVSLRDRILLIHYFTQSKGTALTGKQITYRDLPGGLVYYPTFTKRTIQPLTDFFGEKPPLLIKAGELFAAASAQTGDASLLINVFPRVPVTVILWQGEGELPPGLNLLYDANITDYLESEDVTIVCETITWRLINYARNL